MSAPLRSALLSSPGVIAWDGATIHSEADIVASFVRQYFDVASSAHGPVGRRLEDRYVEVTLAPRMWSDLAKLFPYASLNIGDRLFGATDKPLVITPRNGAPLTIKNAMPTALAGLRLSANKSILTGMTFTGLLADGGDPADVTDYFEFGNVAANAALAGLDLSKIPNCRYSAGFDGETYESRDGFEIEFAVATERERPDGYPTLNFILTGLGATARFAPSGLTEAQYAALMGWDGEDIGGQKALEDLVITGTGNGAPIVTLKNVQLEAAQAGYGATVARTGEVQFAAVRQPSAGVLVPLWTFSAVGS